MSKPKLKSKGKAQSAPKQADNLGKSIMDSAQQIWLAGLGAFAKAQEEGTKLFDTLVREGVSLEQKTRKLALGKADSVRDVVENSVSQVKERTQETWDKLEKVFEDRVSRAMGKLGVPGRKELNEIAERVEELSRQVRKLKPAGTAKPVAAAKPAAAAPKAKRASKAKPAAAAE